MHKIRGLTLNWKQISLLTIGSIIQAVNINLFLLPAKIAPGGVSGVAIIIQEFTGWSVGLMMFLINIPLLYLGFRNLDRFNFLSRTFYVVILTSISVDLFAKFLPPEGITDDLLLNALYAAVVGGLGNGFVFRGQGTSGGTSILGRVLQLKTGIPLSQVYIFTDGIVIIIAGLVFGWKLALYAMITLYLWGMFSDQVLEGPSVVRTVFIITDQPKSTAQAVFQRMGIGITAWDARGMFSDHEHTVLFCTINRPDVPTLRQVVLEIDPKAFMVIGHGHQAIGGVLPRNIQSSVPITKGKVE